MRNLNKIPKLPLAWANRLCMEGDLATPSIGHSDLGDSVMGQLDLTIFFF